MDNSARNEQPAAGHWPTRSPRAHERLAELADYCIPVAIREVADLGIADLLAKGPRPAGELAEEVGADRQALTRVLRALASRGVFTEESSGRFANTPLSSLLRSDHPLSMRDSLTIIPSHLRAWASFDHSVRTGRPAFDHVHGQTEWEYLASHADEARRFDRSMRSLSVLLLRTSLRAYPWRELQTVADIGGGDGTFLTGLLTRCKDLHGVLVDQADVVAAAPDIARAAGVSARIQVVAGDIFQPLPAGHGGYVLKLVLHAFDDDAAATILQHVREAMRQDSRLLVIDSVIPPGDAFDPGKIMDLQMLATTRGHERTEAEFRSLLTRSGLRLNRVIPTPSMPIVEAVLP